MKIVIATCYAMMMTVPLWPFTDYQLFEETAFQMTVLGF